MTNFTIGVIFGIAALLLCIYVIGKRIKKELGEDYETLLYQNQKNDIKRNITFCIKDDEYTAEHLDDDKNIIAFMSVHPNNIKSADFYYSLFTNKQIIKIIYENENDRIYNAVITQIKLIDENTLRIYYTVINN